MSTCSCFNPPSGFPCVRTSLSLAAGTVSGGFQSAERIPLRSNDAIGYLRDGTLLPDYSGIRPKISGKGEGQRDFYIDAPRDHGLPRLVHMFGIESPGLTSSLSLGQEVVELLEA